MIEKNEYIRKENLYKENILNSSYNGIVTIDEKGMIGFANSYAHECFADSPLVGRQFRLTPLAEFLTDDLFTPLFRSVSSPAANGRSTIATGLSW